MLSTVVQSVAGETLGNIARSAPREVHVGDRGLSVLPGPDGRSHVRQSRDDVLTSPPRPRAFAAGGRHRLLSQNGRIGRSKLNRLLEAYPVGLWAVGSLLWTISLLLPLSGRRLPSSLTRESGHVLRAGGFDFVWARVILRTTACCAPDMPWQLDVFARQSSFHSRQPRDSCAWREVGQGSRIGRRSCYCTWQLRIREALVFPVGMTS